MRRRGVGEQAVAVEPLDVVALVGRAVAPDVDAVLLHRAHEQRAGHGAAEGRRVEVGACRRSGCGTRRTRGRRSPLRRGRSCSRQPRDLGAVLERAAGDRVDVVLVGLAEVAGVGAGDRALVAHPRDGDGGVEAPGEGDADALADGQGLQDLRHALKSTERHPARSRRPARRGDAGSDDASDPASAAAAQTCRRASRRRCAAAHRRSPLAVAADRDDRPRRSRRTRPSIAPMYVKADP